MKSFIKVVAIIFSCIILIVSVLSFPIKDMMMAGTDAEKIGEVIGQMFFNIALFSVSIFVIRKLYISLTNSEPKKK